MQPESDTRPGSVSADLSCYLLRKFEDLHRDNGMAAMHFVSMILRRFIDEMAIDASMEFAAAQPSPREKAS